MKIQMPKRMEKVKAKLRMTAVQRHIANTLTIVVLVAVAWTGAPRARAGAPSDLPDAAALFFKNLKTLCGHRFEGATEFPDDPNHPLAGKKLTITFESCDDREIRIPLHAGEDKSRTWILTLSGDRLLLKHDHRHPDGTPDKVTMYGGWAVEGDALRQRFPADGETAKLIPEAATNVWTIEMDAARERITYALERDGQPRYKATFSLRPAANTGTAAR